MRKQMLATHRDRIDTINGQDGKVPAATQWDPEMVIDNENV